MGFDGSLHKRSRAYDAVVANGDSAQDRHVSRDPDVVFDVHRQRDFRVVDVDGMLIRIEDPRPHPDQAELSNRNLLLRGQHACAELRSGADLDSRSLAYSQKNRGDVGA